MIKFRRSKGSCSALSGGVSMRREERPSFNRLFLGTSVAVALLSGYGSRQAFSGQCTAGATAGTYTCSGAADPATDVVQAVSAGSGTALVVTTAD